MSFILKLAYTAAFLMFVVGVLVGGKAGESVVMMASLAVLAAALYHAFTKPRKPIKGKWDLTKRALKQATGISDVAGSSVEAYSEFKAATEQTTGAVKSLFTRLFARRTYRHETFEDACARQGMTEQRLRIVLHRCEVSAMLFTVFFWLSTACALAYMLCLSLHGTINSISAMAIFGSLALRDHFNADRIRRRRFFPAVPWIWSNGLRAMNVFAW